MFAVPEYNYSIPGGLKNALDWVSRPPATSPMRGKPIGLVGAATGMSGTIRAQLHMRQMLVYSDSPCLSQPEVLIPRAHERFDKATGKLTDESTRELLARFGSRVRRLHRPLSSLAKERVVIAGVFDRRARPASCAAAGTCRT